MTLAAPHPEDTIRAAAEALTTTLDTAAHTRHSDIDEIITELTDHALDLLASWPATAPNGEVRDLLTLLKRARDAHAGSDQEGLDLALVGMRTVIAQLLKQGLRTQIEEPSEALTFLDNTLDEWTTDELARVVGAQPRVLTNWRTGTRPRPEARIRLLLVAELVAELRTTMTARGVRMWFDNPVPQLGDQSPLQLLDHNVALHQTTLLEFVRGGLR